MRAFGRELCRDKVEFIHSLAREAFDSGAWLHPSPCSIFWFDVNMRPFVLDNELSFHSRNHLESFC